MSTDFPDRLVAAVRRCRNPVLVGLDPRWASLPAPLRHDVENDSHASRAAAYVRFCRGVIDVVADRVPAVKPQAAFFEQLGPAGMSALADVIGYAADRGLNVILDGKRNDIGSTAEAYADGWLGGRDSGAWGADALTVSPYLGEDSLMPFVDVAVGRGAGIFVLVKTSNPGGRTFQDLVADERPIYEHVAALVNTLAGDSIGESGYGAVGAVAGATYPDQLTELRSLMPKSWLLVPGYGAQGAAAAQVAGAFDRNGLGAVINSSRAIIFAHTREEYRGRFVEKDWQRAVEAATNDMIAELRSDTLAGRL